jgi:REP-associated tyrosine transposase
MILRQSWRACPASHEPRRNLRPRLAAHNQWARIEAIHRNREFLAAYRDSGLPAGLPQLERPASVVTS